MAAYPTGANAYTRGQSSLARASADSLKGSFFDRDAVLKAMDKAAAQKLSRHGAFVRRRAQTSIRYRIQPSVPGHPPSGHKTMMRTKTNKRTGISKRQEVSPLREFIFFAYMAKEKAVMIGPAKTNQKNAEGSGGKTIPEVLEYGGQVRLQEHLHTWRDGRQTWERTDLRFRVSAQSYRSAVGKQRRERVTNHPARPFMHPAQAAELPALMESFRNSL
jgi:hypothetical protein